MRYKVSNTTVKKPRLHPTTGLDLRPAVERVGHGITIRPDSGEHIILQVNRSRIFDKITDGMRRLANGGFIAIDPINDVSEVLANHTLDSRRERELDKEDLLAARDLSHVSSGNRMARAAEMGKDSHVQAGGIETDEAINPDGDPNFVVRTDKVLKKKQKLEKPLLTDEVSAEAGN